MPILRLVAVFLFIIAGIRGAGWFGETSTQHLIADVTFGLAFFAASFLPSSPPSS